MNWYKMSKRERTMPKWERIDSSCVDSVAYESKTRELKVKFPSGVVYLYEGVEPKTYQNFIDSPSKGRFFNSVIKPKYNASKLEKE